MTTLTATTISIENVKAGDLVRTEATEVEVTDAPRKSLFGHGWMIPGREVVDGVVQRGDFLHQHDGDTITVWR